jgi:integrase
MPANRLPVYCAAIPRWYTSLASGRLARYAEPGSKGLVLIGPKRGMPRGNNFNPIWRTACVAAGVPDAHFHDLRHTGGTLAATTGATIKELMPMASGSSCAMP